MGIQMAAKLADNFSKDWILEQFLPKVVNQIVVDKKGYNYRMACLYSLSAVLPYTPKDAISQHMIPVFLKAMKDDIPNVRFSVSKIIIDNKDHIDKNVF